MYMNIGLSRPYTGPLYLIYNKVKIQNNKHYNCGTQSETTGRDYWNDSHCQPSPQGCCQPGYIKGTIAVVI